MREVLRERNRRGEGGKLRDDILAAATALLEQTGSAEAVTLRAGAPPLGISASTDAQLDSKAIWVALHGYATLHVLVGGFPWPDTDVMLNRIVYGLAQITSTQKRRVGASTAEPGGASLP